jgi:hypothetical protein
MKTYLLNALESLIIGLFMLAFVVILAISVNYLQEHYGKYQPNILYNQVDVKNLNFLNFKY